ncbi:hypothetical protein ACFL1U_02850 [Patescibacteria group bacterium]
MSEPKRFLSFTIFELFTVVVVIAVAAASVIYFVSPEKKEIQARNLERSLEMQSYMDGLRQNKKDNPERGLVVLGKIPAERTEIGTCAKCFNLKKYLIPGYLEALPADPHVDEDEETGYYIYRDEEGNVFIEAPHAELGVDLVDKEKI